MTLHTPGSTVFVRWYGKTLQGEVVPDDHRVPLFASMVHVRVPIQGTPVIAVFMPAHVYATADSVPAGSVTVERTPALSSVAGVDSATPALIVPAVPSPSWSTPALDAHRARYRQFKADHWDEEHDHLRVDALEEFYQLFREGVTLRQRRQRESEPSPILEHETLKKEHETLKKEQKPLKQERKQLQSIKVQLSLNFAD